MNVSSLLSSIMESNTFIGLIEVGSPVITGPAQILLDTHVNVELMGTVSTPTFAATVTPPPIRFNVTLVIL